MFTPIEKEMSLGFAQEQEIYTIYSKQNDNKRVIHFSLIDDTSPYQADTSLAVYFKEKFSDGTMIVPQKLTSPILEWDPDNYGFRVNLTKEMTAVPGMAYCEISLLYNNGSPPEIDDNGIIKVDTDILTTQTFNIYIEESVTNNGTVRSEASTDDLVELILAINALSVKVSNDEDIRISNENTRISNENTRISNENDRQTNESTRQSNDAQRDINEDERQRAEQERKACEGIGDYTTHINMSYTDTNGNTQTINYEDSRVGIFERMVARTGGGSYIDENGNSKTASNDYTDIYGNIHTADVSILDSKSILAAYAKAISDDEYYAKLAESFAHGGTGYTFLQADRPTNEDIDNAYYWYLEAKSIAQSIGSVLIPCGTIYFAQLPTSNIAQGIMYNIKDSFTTDSRFSEGAGHDIAAGANVYWTANNEWDILAGNMVSGVKGEAEQAYRTGNVNITKDNLGIGHITNNRVYYISAEPSDVENGDIWIG